MSDDRLVEELARVADTGELPGDEGLVWDRLRTYFVPDASGVPDDASRAHVLASLDDIGPIGAEAE